MWIFEDLANDDFFFDNHGHNLHRHERPIQAINSAASSDSCSSHPSATSSVSSSSRNHPPHPHATTESVVVSSPCLLFAIDVWKEQLQLTVENQGTGIGSDGSKVVDVVVADDDLINRD